MSRKFSYPTYESKSAFFTTIFADLHNWGPIWGLSYDHWVSTYAKTCGAVVK